MHAGEIHMASIGAEAEGLALALVLLSKDNEGFDERMKYQRMTPCYQAFPGLHVPCPKTNSEIKSTGEREKSRYSVRRNLGSSKLN